jgi:23S rRNA pseudouridine1911/1915/1917 synthase
MKIFYQDNDIIVCEKEYGVSSQKSEGANMLDMIREITGVEPFPVHRLDITTRGIMVYALNQKSAGELSRQIQAGTFKKTYLAIVHGHTEDEGEMVDFLYHDRLKNKSFAVKTKRQGAKEARLDFTTLQRAKIGEDELSLLHIRLHTGRTHQIRVQFSSRSYPLYGDGKYGAKDNAKIALYSHSLCFLHPKTKKQMYFDALPSGEIWDELASIPKPL